MLAAGIDGKSPRQSIHGTKRQRGSVLAGAHPKSMGFGQLGRDVSGEDGSMPQCVGRWHSLDFAFCISHFLLAHESLSWLSAMSKNLPTRRQARKKASISRFQSQISTELNGCVFSSERINLQNSRL